MKLKYKCFILGNTVFSNFQVERFRPSLILTPDVGKNISTAHKFKMSNNSVINISKQIPISLYIAYFSSFSAYLIAFNLVLGFSFLAASLSLFLVRERVDRSSLLQTLAGVDPFCFWFSAFVWDFINCMIPCLLSVVSLYVCAPTFFNASSGYKKIVFLLDLWVILQKK